MTALPVIQPVLWYLGKADSESAHIGSQAWKLRDLWLAIPSSGRVMHHKQVHRQCSRLFFVLQ
jgi:hypothetical protein